MWLRETRDAEIAITVKRDWRSPVVEKTTTKMYSGEDAPAFYDQTPLGTTGAKFVDRRPYWTRAQIYVPSNETFKITISGTGLWEFVGMGVRGRTSRSRWRDDPAVGDSMAWKYPPNLIKGDYVVDSIAINENYLSVVDETSGYLNEHNFSATNGYPFERPQLARGYALRLFYAYKDVSSTANDVKSDEDVSIARVITVPTGAGWVRVKTTPSFQTFADEGMTLTFTSRGGPTWLCASFTLHNHVTGIRRSKTLGASGGTVFDVASDSMQKTKGFGFNCALELDGTILNESLVGSGDMTNDYFVDELNITEATLKVHPKGGGGIHGAMNAVVIDTIMDLEPGQHTVRIAVQNILSSNGTGVDVCAVSSRELFALELTN